MPTGLRIGVASQTPLVRMKRELEELEAVHGPLPDPLPLRRLRRSADYSVTPGGVSRMVWSLVREFDLRGEWTALSNGFPRDLEIGGFRLGFATLSPEAKAAYGRAKETAWEALNRLHPAIEAPLQDDDFLRAFTAWSEANAAKVLERHAEDPFDVLYVNDWQHLPQGRMLRGVPRLLHYHVPFADWTPAGWRDYLLRGFDGFDAVVVSTRAGADALRRAGCARPVHQVYPWIDLEDHRAPTEAEVASFCERFGLGDGDEVVVNVGRMDPIKGQDHLVRAFARIARARPRAKLVLAGNGSFSSSKRGGIGLSKGKLWRSSLERLVHQLGLDDRVVFTGHLRQTDVRAALHRADVFAFPSVAEGFGLAVVEAWVQGKPVVVSAGAGVSEIVRPEENGLVADPTRNRAFADAVVALLDDPERAERMGRAGRETALALCDVRRRGGEVLGLLEALAEGRRPDLPVAP